LTVQLFSVTSLLNALNDAQREAVTAPGGPCLVIAGAGSGKTRVLTYRIAWLLSQGVTSGQILALTFTNKAAREMKERIAYLVGEKECRHLWMGTFHSVFARILRIEGSVLGFTSSFTIYDTQDAKNLVKTIIKELQLDDKVYPPGEIYGRISSAKNNLITPQAYARNQEIIRQDTAARKPMVAEIYARYASRCRKANAMDFDDLLLYTNILFRDFPDVLKKYQERFLHVLVDEYQDTNFSQYLIVSKLVQKHRNVFVVGDDAQSIYGFRGARIENILNFKNDYPEYRLFKLEQNYRSTQTIVNAANSLIENNQGQLRKKVWSALEAGEKIQVARASSDAEEAMMIAADIHQIRFSRQAAWKDFAILYRTNAQSRILEESLRKLNIPYKIYGGLSFYQRKEIKDLLAYFRLVVNPNDDEALLRIINVPARGIGDTTMEKLQAAAAERGTSIWSVISDETLTATNIGSGIQNKIRGFVSLIRTFMDKLASASAWDLAMDIAEKSGLLKELHNDQSPEGVTRFENIQELLNSISSFQEESAEEEVPTLTRFLENVSLLTDQDTEKETDHDKVTLMTVHSAKGLEFPYIYITGLEEKLFPSYLSMENPSDLEEERRLFYVALTRAKTRAFLSWAQSRFRWGQPVDCTPSRFIREIDPRYIEKTYSEGEEKRNGRRPYAGNTLFREPDGPSGLSEPRADLPVRTMPPPNWQKVRKGETTASVTSSGFQTIPVEKLKSGARVHHDRFGPGTILSLEGEYPDLKASVQFDEAGTRQLLLKFAKLRLLDAEN
jgi:DNA helicase-2/ATP-dependent DNA helicase PcrA